MQHAAALLELSNIKHVMECYGILYNFPIFINVYKPSASPVLLLQKN